MQGARPFGRVQSRSPTSFGPLTGGGEGAVRKFSEIFSGNFFSKKIWVQKDILWVPRAKKSVFVQKKISPKIFFWDLAIFGPAAPGKSPGPAAGAPKRYFGHKDRHTSRFLCLKTVFRCFAGRPIVLEASETVGDQLWAPLVRRCKVVAGEELSTI